MLLLGELVAPSPGPPPEPTQQSLSGHQRTGKSELGGHRQTESRETLREVRGEAGLSTVCHCQLF